MYSYGCGASKILWNPIIEDKALNVLITGGAGFIGSHLGEAMLNAGCKVVAVDDLSTGSLDNIKGLMEKDRFEFVHDSVQNVQIMNSLVGRCDVIFHLAAAVGVQLIVEQPVHTIETNIHGSEVMLELANKFRRKILIASTSEVYGKNTKTPFNEDDDVTFGSTKFTRWSYACSKMIDEFLALAYHNQDNLDTIVCRFFNTIGPRQTGSYGMVVPRFVRRALRGEPIEIYGSGEQSRCFCNVSDVVGALQELIECDNAVGEIINIGTQESITINELAKMVLGMIGSDSTIRHLSYEEAYGRPFDDLMVRIPDLSKAARLIGYAPKCTLDETLREVIEFERQHL